MNIVATNDFPAEIKALRATLESIEAVSDPSFMSGERTRAWATTFDLLDNQGNPTHEDIAVAGFSEDECQAWIRVSNSTKSATNVLVTFPGSPAPIPGDVRAASGPAR